MEDIPEFAGQPIGGTFTLYFDVEDVRDLFEKVKSRINLVSDGLYETFYGTTEFTMRDPNGYILTFAQDNGWFMEHRFGWLILIYRSEEHTSELQSRRYICSRYGWTW